MFARLKTVTQNGRTYQYLQVLEAYRDQGRSRHRVVANLGRYDDAVTTAANALRGAKAANNAQLAQEIEARLALYKARRPYRQPQPRNRTGYKPD